MRENQAGHKSYVLSSFAIAALAVVFVLHFAFTQFVALQSENEAMLNEIINEPGAEIKVEATTKPDLAVSSPQIAVPPAVEVEKTNRENNAGIIKTRQAVETKPTASAVAAPPAAAAVKKKEPRDTRSERRLRRAERILTGI